MTTNRHSDEKVDYYDVVAQAAMELGFVLPKGIETRPSPLPFWHPNGNRVYVRRAPTKKQALRNIKELVKASGSRLPLSEYVELRPRPWPTLLRRNLNRAESYDARMGLMSRLRWIDELLDNELRRKKPDYRAVNTNLGHRELVGRELRRLGVWIEDYIPEEERLP